MPETLFQVKPQLCKTLEREKLEKYLRENRASYVMVEPKYDGLRCIARLGRLTGDGSTQTQLYSRNGKPFWNVDHIIQELSDSSACNMVFDGELFTTDWNLSMGIVKSSKTKHPEAEKVKFHIWDGMPLARWNQGTCPMSLMDRRATFVNELFSGNSFRHLLPVTQDIARSWDEIMAVYERRIQEGYEGVVVKFPDSIYELGKRSPGWLKFKPYTDADLTIVDCIEGEGKRTGKVGALLLSGEVEIEGKQVKIESECGVFRCDDAELSRMWNLHQEKQLVGLLAEIRFDSVTADGKMRFPRFYRLREDRERTEVAARPKKLTAAEKRAAKAEAERQAKLDEWFNSDEMVTY